MANDTASTGLLLALGGALALFAWSRTQAGREASGDLVERIAMWSPSKRAEIFRPLFDAATARYQLPPRLLMRVAQQESNFNPSARSIAGAVGLMQIVPKYHPEMGEAGALDPARAIPYAAKLLRAWFNRYGTWSLALAAYNAGPGNVDKYQGVPPFEETRNYVTRILLDLGIAEPGVRFA